ncbi:MAG: hypothetical protein HY094_05955 [Candidatus Melainabacteria bacterium]|nr:hypothetical protein [Candidatus Melainabacteria bacterium]
MKITNKLRIIAASTVLSVPIGVYSCNKLTEKPAVVNPANEAIESERKSLQMKEGELVKVLNNWLSWLNTTGSHLREEKIDDPMTEFNFVLQEFGVTRVGDGCDAIVPPETDLDKIVDDVKKIARSVVPPKKQKNDFRLDPSKDQVEAFIKAVKMGVKVAPQIVLDDIYKSIEKRGKKFNRSIEGIKESKEIALEGFEIYQRFSNKLILETPKFIESIEKFNKDAKAAGQTSYEARWGLSLELLKSLKSIK